MSGRRAKAHEVEAFRNTRGSPEYGENLEIEGLVRLVRGEEKDGLRLLEDARGLALDAHARGPADACARRLARRPA